MDNDNNLISDDELEAIIMEHIPEVPKALEGRVMISKTKALALKKNRRIRIQRNIAVSIVMVLMMTLISLNFEVIAQTINNLPFFDIDFSDPDSTGSNDLGIYNAKKNGLKQMDSIKWEIEGLTLEVYDFFIDETRITFNYILKGALVEEAVKNNEFVNIELFSKELGREFLLRGQDVAYEEDGVVIKCNGLILLRENKLDSIISVDKESGISSIAFELIFSVNNSGESGEWITNEFIDFEIQEDRIDKNKKIYIKNTDRIKTDYGIIEFEELIMSPTSISLKYDETYRNDIYDIKLLNPVLSDEFGNEFNLIDIRGNYPELVYGPSLYYNEVLPKLFLNYDGFELRDNRRFLTIKISDEEQKIEYGDNAFIFPKVTYSNGYLRIDEPYKNNDLYTNLGFAYHLYSNHLEKQPPDEGGYDETGHFFEYEIGKRETYTIELLNEYIKEFEKGSIELILEGDSNE